MQSTGASEDQKIMTFREVSPDLIVDADSSANFS
jgi:hypothetical protein